MFRSERGGSVVFFDLVWYNAVRRQSKNTPGRAEEMSMKEKLRFFLLLIKEKGFLFLLAAVMIIMSACSFAAPFLICILPEKEPTPYDELHEATVQVSSVGYYSNYRNITSHFSIVTKDEERFTIQNKYFKYLRDYLQESSTRELEKKLEELLTSQETVTIKYEISERFFIETKFIRELCIGDIEVVPYQSEPDEDISILWVFIACSFAFLLSLLLSIALVKCCREMIDNARLLWNDMTEEERTKAISIRRRRNSRD